MFRFAEVSVALILAKGFNEHEQFKNVGCKMKVLNLRVKTCRQVHNSFTWTVRTAAARQRTFESTGCEAQAEAALQRRVEITGGLDEGGQVTKGVWGMSWR